MQLINTWAGSAVTNRLHFLKTVDCGSYLVIIINKGCLMISNGFTIRLIWVDNDGQYWLRLVDDLGYL